LKLETSFIGFGESAFEVPIDELRMTAECARAARREKAVYLWVPFFRESQPAGYVVWARSLTKDFDSIDEKMAQEFADKVSVNFEMALLYRKLHELKSAAESANTAKTHLLANVSHELRSPLGAVIGFSELLASSSPTAFDRQDWGHRIRNHAGQLQRIIDDVLDMSKVEVGTLDFEITKVDFKILLQEVLIISQTRAREKGIAIEFIAEEELPRYILTDETRLTQILSNVIGNAIKFTTAGLVSVKIGRVAQSESKIYFKVIDSGIGVPKDQIEKLFKPFSQGDAATVRQFGGSGLGLALAKGLAQNLGGELVLLESVPGLGSTFLATVDIGPSQNLDSFRDISPHAAAIRSREEGKDSLVDALTGKSILVVEDSEDLQLLIKRYLESAGAKVSLSGNGEDGVETALSEHFDVVLMDVYMPVKDGCEAATELRQKNYKGLLIALTASALKEERDRCLDSGFDAHLSKPMRRADLICHIKQIHDSFVRLCSSF
jgi:signal transduction histidine kinase/CheY-like chemotaxis protein